MATSYNPTASVNTVASVSTVASLNTVAIGGSSGKLSVTGELLNADRAYGDPGSIAHLPAASVPVARFVTSEIGVSSYVGSLVRAAGHDPVVGVELFVLGCLGLYVVRLLCSPLLWSIPRKGSGREGRGDISQARYRRRARGGSGVVGRHHVGRSDVGRVGLGGVGKALSIQKDYMLLQR